MSKKHDVFEWQTDSRALGRGQLEIILKDLGIQVVSEHDTHLSVYCPFHMNHNTPAASVEKKTGYFYCFNAACAKRMPLVDIVKLIKKVNTFESMRYVERYKTDEVNILDELEEIYATNDDLAPFDVDLLAHLQQEYTKSRRAQLYLRSRGINEFTADYFGMAYDPSKDMVCTPMYSTDGVCIGLIGRSIIGKSFKNSLNLPSRKTLFNINNAKRQGLDTLILTESNFDAQRIHQAGFANVCATLGGTFSQYHMTQVYRHFDKVILMTDDDEPGLRFASKITRKCKRAGVAAYRGRYDEYHLFPNGAKDVCDRDQAGRLLVSERDIHRCIQNADIML